LLCNYKVIAKSITLAM